MAASLIDPNATGATRLTADHLTAIIPGGIASQTLLQQPRGKAMVFNFDAGQEMNTHTNPNHALVLPTHGRLIITAADQRFELGPGDVLHFPPHLPHAVHAPNAAGFVLFLLQPEGSGPDEA